MGAFLARECLAPSGRKAAFGVLLRLASSRFWSQVRTCFSLACSGTRSRSGRSGFSGWHLEVDAANLGAVEREGDV